MRTLMIKPEKLKNLYTILVLVMIVLTLNLFTNAWGKLTSSFGLRDSATAAKFDVEIEAPADFWPIDGENLLEYYFLSAIDIKGLGFGVINRGETNVLCVPQVNNGIKYRVYVDGKEQAEFTVKAKEKGNFWLVIDPAGLDKNIKEAEFFIEIRQAERRG